MNTDRSAPHAEQTADFEVLSLLEEIPGTVCPGSVQYAYWLGVKRAHARALFRQAESATTDDAKNAFARLALEAANEGDRYRELLRKHLSIHSEGGDRS